MPRAKKQHLKRRKDGRYVAVYHGRAFYGSTEDAALAARADFIRRERAGLYMPERITISEYSARWIDAYCSHLTAATYNTRARYIDRLVDLIGDIPIASVRPTDLSRYMQRFAGMSDSTIRNAASTVKSLFRAALADGIIPRDPSAALTLPHGTRGTHRAITPAERDLIMRTQHRLRPAALLMLFAGLRRGEVLALNIDRDVDFAARTITVRSAVRFAVDGTPRIVDPKTEAGKRVIPLLDELADELRPLHGLACPSASGAMMTSRAWIKGWSSYNTALAVTLNGHRRRRKTDPWTPVNIRAHDLRHTFATYCYNAGVDLKSCMSWMGHADQTVTMRIYTHLTAEREKSSENALRESLKTAFHVPNDVQNKNDPRET